MTDAYAYDAGEGPSEAGVVALCKKIGATKTKDALIKALKQLATALEAAPQDVGALGRAKAELPRLLWGLVQQQSDKDVKLGLAVCIVHMLRIWAPSTPYDDEPECLEVSDEAFEFVRAPCFARIQCGAVLCGRCFPPTPHRSFLEHAGAAGSAALSAYWLGWACSRRATSDAPCTTDCALKRCRTTTAGQHGTQTQGALQSILWVVNRLQNHSAPTFQLAVSVLQVFCEVR